jgi:hypothetical protein
MSDESLIAVFVDYENLAIGVRDAKMGRFRMDLVLKRLLEKGRIVYKRAYCDWGRYRDDVAEFHRHGVELIDIPQTSATRRSTSTSSRCSPATATSRRWCTSSRRTTSA